MEDVDSVGSVVLWSSFGVLVFGMLAIDLFGAAGGRKHVVSVREALAWSLVWVALSMAFAAGLWLYLDVHEGREIAHQSTLEFLTGYVIEKSLSVDNVFVWLMLFAYFGIPPELQKRVLLFGVLGAIVLRTIMIFAGSWLIVKFHWILYLFGAFLMFTGFRMYWFADSEPDLERHPLLIWLRRHVRLVTRLQGEHFFVMKDGLRFATPLFLALCLVEVSDLVFAVDSIPAIFAVTTDPFVVLTSNVFAILGLRSMFFLLADAAGRFAMLKHGIATVLIFIGVKMLMLDLYKIPVGFSLAVVVAILLASVLVSLRKTRHEAQPGARLGNDRDPDL